MKDTSIASYHKLDPAKVASDTDLILSFLRRWSPQRYSNRDIAKATGLNVTVVWSRTSALAKKGVLIDAGVMYDAETRRDVHTWRLRDAKVS